AKRHNSTLFMVFLAALEVLIARHAGVDDVVVGVPTPGRPRSETENLIGCFINLVPIRTHLHGNPNFSSVIEQTRRTTLEALENSSVPYGQIFGAVRPWSADRVPLYRVHFQMRDFHHESRQSKHLEVGVLEPQLGPSNHLTVRATTTPSGATITFSYHPERFEQATIERWLGHYARLLDAVGGNADQTILDIPLIDDDERRTLLEVFNPPESPYLPVPELAADGLRSTAARLPDVVAMEDGVRRVSYAELDRMVDAIAWSLAERNLTAEDAVILHADRTIEAAAAVFGAMRAGVAYVPIDADLTSEWLETVVEQTKPGLILTTRVASPRPDEIDVVEVSHLLADQRPPFPGKPKPQDLAYLLYTSGSTGPPKGVMVEQGNVAWFLEQTANFEPLGPGDRIIWFHSLSFDAHMNSLHAALVGGATVVIRDETTVYSIPRLVGWMAEREISHLRISAGFFHVLVEELIATNSPVPRTLRLIAFGGEQVRADIINTWLTMTGGSIRTVDSYGPTEATVWVAANDFPQPQPAAHEWISIGPPRAPSQVYVLDSRGELAPIGIHGELFIGGPLVARGYLNAPELTAQRFTPDRFSKLEGTRMYRSGDVGRWLPNGTLEVIGRVDRQVKIRGYRVEPAEVEAALRTALGVDAAVVIASPGADGELELRAFVTSDQDRSLDLQAVRDALGIPKFMVPARLIQVPEIPLTIGGKVDSNALLRGEVEIVEPAAPALAHVDAIERIWCDVLGLEAIEQHDDFFALGGHSLLAIKVISRIKAQLDLAIELTQLFEYPTFGAFSDLVATIGRGATPEGTNDTWGSAPNGEDDLDDFLTALEQMTDEEAEAMMRRIDAGQE
ncbi:MAG: amino acid adenylation domain-containing protein, partial [Acidimicrobiia bacterium]|nr:amino acid adenylation domain-containing protein [Acidimicrobiia bacterium]